MFPSNSSNSWKSNNSSNSWNSSNYWNSNNSSNSWNSNNSRNSRNSRNYRADVHMCSGLFLTVCFTSFVMSVVGLWTLNASVFMSQYCVTMLKHAQAFCYMWQTLYVLWYMAHQVVSLALLGFCLSHRNHATCAQEVQTWRVSIAASSTSVHFPICTVSNSKDCNHWGITKDNDQERCSASEGQLRSDHNTAWYTPYPHRCDRFSYHRSAESLRCFLVRLQN